MYIRCNFKKRIANFNRKADRYKEFINMRSEENDSEALQKSTLSNCSQQSIFFSRSMSTTFEPVITNRKGI